MALGPQKCNVMFAYIFFAEMLLLHNALPFLVFRMCEGFYLIEKCAVCRRQSRIGQLTVSNWLNSNPMAVSVTNHNNPLLCYRDRFGESQWTFLPAFAKSLLLVWGSNVDFWSDQLEYKLITYCDLKQEIKINKADRIPFKWSKIVTSFCQSRRAVY